VKVHREKSAWEDGWKEEVIDDGDDGCVDGGKADTKKSFSLKDIFVADGSHGRCQLVPVTFALF
jgi:hypothetical protein